MKVSYIYDGVEPPVTPAPRRRIGYRTATFDDVMPPFPCADNAAFPVCVATISDMLYFTFDDNEE